MVTTAMGVIGAIAIIWGGIATWNDLDYQKESHNTQI